MRNHPTIFAMHFVATLLACAPAQKAESTQDSVPAVDQLGEAVSLDVLRERSEYAELGKPAIEALAHEAKAHWPEEFSGFTFLRVERFSAGEVAYWMSIWSHRKTGLEFALVPGGRFQMGSPANEANRRADELQHWVTLDPFLIARTECTQEAWAKIATPAAIEGGSFSGSDQLPVGGISPLDVEAWCSEANLTFPTEAQWEYMCRAGTTTTWAMGDNKRDLIQFANIGSAECPPDWIEMEGMTEPWRDGYGNETAEIGMFECNAFGLFDVHGNLNEWCRDDYFSYEVQPEKGTGLRPGVSGERQARGGNYAGGAGAARSAKRLTCGAGTSAGNHGFGFRPSQDLAF